jgi:hypothetical protein
MKPQRDNKIVVWVPPGLKDELQALANAADRSLSDYARRVLVADVVYKIVGEEAK